jgi:2TM domain
MPPKLSSPPDPRSPEYRELRDKINFALHVAFFAATNSGIAFFQRLHQADWPWQAWLGILWFLGLAVHGIYVFALARYSEPI